jgi:hypothetical protein
MRRDQNIATANVTGLDKIIFPCVCLLYLYNEAPGVVRYWPSL